MADLLEDFLPLAEQVNILFQHVLHPEGRPYTLDEVSQQCHVSVATLSQLRTGRITNPQLSTLRSLCRFFQVPLRYFETRSVEACYAVLAEKQPDDNTTELNEIAFRAIHLSPEAQRDVLKVIQWVQAAERLRHSGIDIPALPGLDDNREPSGD